MRLLTSHPKYTDDIQLFLLRNSEAITAFGLSWNEGTWASGVYSLTEGQNGRIQSQSLELTAGIHQIQKTRIKEWSWGPEKVKKTFGWGLSTSVGESFRILPSNGETGCQALLSTVVSICCEGNASYQKGPWLYASSIVHHYSSDKTSFK